MAKFLMRFFAMIFLFITMCYAESVSTKRVPQFSNEKVKVWKTILYPSHEKILKKHRHDQDRIVVALTDGILKVTNDKGKTYEWRLEKDKAYYQTADIRGELHTDENMSDHPIKVIVIELN